jgi:hypothetical protein
VNSLAAEGTTCSNAIFARSDQNDPKEDPRGVHLKQFCSNNFTPAAAIVGKNESDDWHSCRFMSGDHSVRFLATKRFLDAPGVV